MLIYNHNKEFIGIDNNDLQTLGFHDLEQLLVEIGDFADLFVRTPGHIHNFKHVHWIDYVMVDGSSEHSKVIINANKNLYRAELQIGIAFLSDEPAKEAYFVSLHGLRMLTQSERSSISHIPDFAAEPTTLPKKETDTKKDQPEQTSLDLDQQSITSQPQPTVETQPEPLPSSDEYSLDDEDLFISDVQSTEPAQAVENEIPDILDVPDVPVAADQNDKALQAVLDNNYTYDPHVASGELGLPVDLIEEFIEDFIAQAREFKPEIYDALDAGDSDKVKTLSHKLKGVAANLRIEDAFEVLTVVNNTTDLGVARENLDIFYLIIEKLAGNELAAPSPADVQDTTVEEPETAQTSDEDEMTLEFKDDSESEPYLQIDDEDVPEQLELAELADDDFAIEDIHGDNTPLEDDLLKIEDETQESIIQEPEISLEYSHEQAAAQIGLDIESFEELLNDYSQESQELVATMKTALQNDDLQFIKKLAHQLKGMSRNMRLENIAAQAESIEQTEDADTIRQVLASIEVLIQEISK